MFLLIQNKPVAVPVGDPEWISAYICISLFPPKRMCVGTGIASHACGCVKPFRATDTILALHLAMSKT